jgi:hypothetical protein
MKNCRADTDIDVTTWAAYTLGCSPHSLGIRCEHLLHEILSNSFDAQEAALGQLTTEVRELKRALRALASGGQVRGKVLVELLETLTRLEGEFRELIESPTMADPEAPGGAAYSEWLHMVGLSAGCVLLSEERELWRKLGEAIGQAQYRLRVVPKLDGDFVPAEVEAILTILRGLRGVAKKAIAQEIRETVREVNKPAKRQTFAGRRARAQARYAALSKLDRRLRTALWGEAAPEMLLTVDEQNITLLGVTRRLTDFRKSDMAILRVLAEHVGEPVEREVIKREGGIQTDHFSLKYHIHRLNEKLKEWGREICEARGCDEPECVKSVFVKGVRATQFAKHGTGGPYRLDVDRSGVRVDGPRPPWMPPLSGK